MINNIEKKFKALFGNNYSVYRAPGRINLLGEHTDYNDGFVLPASINKEIIFAISKNNTKSTCNLYAYNLSEGCTFSLTKMSSNDTRWSNFIKGVIAEIYKKGQTIEGFDMVFGGNIPLGAGLSSSAALSSGTVTALNDMFSLKFKKIELIKIAQLAEQNYTGVMCGIMDQFACIMGKDKRAIKLDCKTLEYNYFPLELKNYQIVLCDTLIKHSLDSSNYNSRIEECKIGVKIIKKNNPKVNNLRDVSVDLINSYKDKMPNKIFNRCSYIINENERVLKAIKALSEYNIKEFSALMYQTHNGLSKKYEVSCIELDFLVNLTKNLDYVLGSRMMGAGFGGCTINVVERKYIEDFKKLILKSYKQSFNIEAKIYEVEVINGAEKLTI